MTKSKSELTEDILKTFEGWSAGSYNDATGSGTIGYGHLLTKHDKALASKTLTAAEGLDLLRKDIHEHQQGAMKGLKVKLTDNQSAALTSLAFNAGKSSKAVREVVKLVNAGKMEDAANEFLKYNTSKDIVLSALTQRRNIEKDLFLAKDGTDVDMGRYGSKKAVASLPKKVKEAEPIPTIVTEVTTAPLPLGETLPTQSSAEVAKTEITKGWWTRLRTWIG